MASGSRQTSGGGGFWGWGWGCAFYGVRGFGFGLGFSLIQCFNFETLIVQRSGDLALTSLMSGSPSGLLGTE